MAVKKCKYCAMQIPDEAKTCPYCRKELPTVTPKWLIFMAFTFIGFFLLILVIREPTDSNTISYDTGQVQADCEKAVMARLKSPATAKFPNGAKISISGSGQGPWTILGWVDSQNSYGAMLRQNYKCKLHYSGTKVLIESLEFN